jgi:recombination protein RecT
MTKNQLVQNQDERMESISTFMARSNVRQKIEDVVGAGTDTFISSVVSAVTTNPSLNECERDTIVSAALLGNSLKLSPSPQLGYFYMVPYNDKKNKRKTAQFQLGYKGYIQLAMRSGQYKDLDVIEVKQGELRSYSRFKGTAEFNEIEDDDERENTPTVGYYAYFELLNGFKKELYWSKEKMEKHVLQYSEAYKSDKRYGNNYSFWSKDFDAMAKKTMLRQILSKWGILSIEMQTAYTSDMASLRMDGQVEYVDNMPEQTPSYQGPEPPKGIEAQSQEQPQTLADILL